MDRVSRCAYCGAVIGVYEPAVVVDEGGVRRTSLAAELHLQRAPGNQYHLACYEELQRSHAAAA